MPGIPHGTLAPTAALACLLAGAAAAGPALPAAVEILAPPTGEAPTLLFLGADGPPGGKAQAAPAATARIASTASRFHPRLQVLAAGTRLEIVNRDPILHNTHLFDHDRTLFNVATPTAGVAVHRRLTRPGLFSVRCDLHRWMKAWIAVVDSPYYAVIDRPGLVRIENVKPGHYLLHILTADKPERRVPLSLQAGERRQMRLLP